LDWYYKNDTNDTGISVSGFYGDISFTNVSKQKYRTVYKLNDVFHRTDGPAVIFYFKSGKVHNEQYMINGVTHRVDGPANICYDEDGFVYYNQWQINGMSHRVDGPAVIRYHSGSEWTHEYYYLLGHKITKKTILYSWLY
jgi:hypothetical protein